MSNIASLASKLDGWALARAAGSVWLLLLVTLLGYLAQVARRRTYTASRTDPKERTVTVAPSQLTVFVKAIMKSLSKTRIRKREDGSVQMPDCVYVQRGVGIDRLHVQRYRKVCGFDEYSFEAPLTYPYTIIFPIQALLLTDKDFPFPAMGVVHLANHIKQYAPILGSEVTVRVFASPDVAPFKGGRGYVFKVISEVYSSGPDADAELLWRCESTYLSMMKVKDAPKDAKEYEALMGEQVCESVASSWTGRLPADKGRQYAAASGDYNPIHLYPFTAMLLGQKSAIMHGMWTKAACIANLVPVEPSRFGRPAAPGQPIAEAFVEFRAAIPLPCRGSQLASSPSISSPTLAPPKGAAAGSVQLTFEVSGQKKDAKVTHVKGTCWYRK